MPVLKLKLITTETWQFSHKFLRRVLADHQYSAKNLRSLAGVKGTATGGKVKVQWTLMAQMQLPHTDLSYISNGEDYFFII